MKKPWYKSKTIWFNALAAVAALGSIPLGGVVGPVVAAKILAAAGVANIVLRVVSKQPIGDPNAEPTDQP